MNNPFIYGGAAKINEKDLLDIFIDSGDSKIITEGENNIFIKGNYILSSFAIFNKVFVCSKNFQ